MRFLNVAQRFSLPVELINNEIYCLFQLKITSSRYLHMNAFLLA